MGKQSNMSLLMIFLILAQGIMVSSEKSIEASSALFNREKRASSSSGLKRKYSPEFRYPQKRGFKDEPVKVMLGTVQIGIGIVVHPLVIAAKSSIFRAKEDYHVKCTGPSGEIIIRKITEIRPYYKSIYLRESPGGINDVALAVTDGPMPFDDVPMPDDNYPVLRRLHSIGRFSPYTVDCINRMLAPMKARLDAREE